MAMGSTAKLGIATGLGFASTTLTDAALRYWAERTPKPTEETPEPEENWYYKYSSLLGGGVSLATAGVLWKTMGKEEALVCALAGIGTALIIPIREAVDEARVEAETEAPPEERLRRLARMRGLRSLGPRTVTAMRSVRQPVAAAAR